MGDENPHDHLAALTLWGACVVLLLGPSALVWIVRSIAFAGQCAPGPELCHGMTLGGGLHDALVLAWGVATNTLFLITVSVVATLAAFFARRPLMGTLSLLLLPILALVLPTLAVFTTKYDNCPISSDGIGNCTLWGAQMGMSLHTAANVPDVIFAVTPYSFALTAVLGVLGYFFARPRKPQAAVHLAAQMRNFEER